MAINSAYSQHTSRCNVLFHTREESNEGLELQSNSIKDVGKVDLVKNYV